MTTRSLLTFSRMAHASIPGGGNPYVAPVNQYKHYTRHRLAQLVALPNRNLKVQCSTPASFNV